MVRYYGYYSNVSRGKRKRQDQDGRVPCILQPDEPSKGYRKNRARLIQKILEHLGLWRLKRKPAPRAHGPPMEHHTDYSDSQIPPSEDYLYTDPQYPLEA